MSTRKEKQQERAKAKLELVKISKAIMFDQFFSIENSPTKRVMLYMNGSKSKDISGHITCRTDFNTLSGQITNYSIKGKHVRLLKKFLDKHDWDSKQFLREDNIKLLLKRQPTEEEKSWADWVFADASLSPDTGMQIVTLRFNAEVEVDLISIETEGISKFVDKAIVAAEQYKDFITKAKVTYSSGEISVVKTEVKDSTVSLGWWPLYEGNEKGYIEI